MRKIVLGVVLLGVIGATVYGANLYHKYNSGYCFAENRYLSEQEIKDVVTANVINRYVIPPPEGRAMYPNYPKLDIETYYKLNPNYRVELNSVFSMPKKQRKKSRAIHGKKLVYHAIIYFDTKGNGEVLLPDKHKSRIRLPLTACGKHSSLEDGL